MRFARNLLRSAGALLLIAVLVFALGAVCAAEDNDPVSFTIQVSPQALTGPGEVSVSLRVSNPSEKDMIDPVTLYDPAGSVVASFGDGGSYVLKSGDSRSWEGKWNVTQEQLDAGAVVYTLRYHLEDETGALVELNRQAVAKVDFTGERVSLNVSRTINPQVVRSGGQASVTYELYNNGNVALIDIRVQENIAKAAKTVKSLGVGEKASVTFTSRIGNADLKSSASITYKATGSTQTLKETVEEALIPLAKPNLKIELSSPTAGVNVGEAATLVITFTNTGNVTYSNVTVKEAKRGEIITNLSIPAGATVTEQKEFILMEPTDFKVTATLPDNTGETRTLTSNELRVGVFDPEKQLKLTLDLTCDQEMVAQVPADVRFHLAVTNNSNIKAEKIAITHGSTPIYTIAALEPGEKMVLDRDVRISNAGQFRFTASLKDTLNNTVTFDSNTIRIAIDRSTPVPTAVPVATVAPPVQVTASPADPLLEQGRNALMTAAAAIGVLLAVGLLLFLISTAVRLRKKSKSKAAYDHLDLAERRDYTEPGDHEAEDESELKAAERRDDEPEEVPMPVVLPHEKVLSDAEKNGTDAAPAAESMPPSDGEGGFRVSRSEEESQTPLAPKTETNQKPQGKENESQPSFQVRKAEVTLLTQEEERAAGEINSKHRRRRSSRKEDGE